MNQNLDRMVIPRHVALVFLDGNGRWAKKRGLPQHHGTQGGLCYGGENRRSCCPHGN